MQTMTRGKKLLVLALLATMLAYFAGAPVQAHRPAPPTPNQVVVVATDYVQGTGIVVHHVVLSDGTACKLASDSLGSLSATMSMSCGVR